MRQFLLGFLATIAAAASAEAALRVDPVRIFLSEGDRARTFLITNEGRGDVILKISAFEWDQGEEGKDSLTPTDKLFYLPRVVRLRPGEGREVKVGLAGHGGGKEKTFRLLVQEEPGMELAASGTRIMLDMSLPVFFAPQVPSPPAVIPVSASVERGKLRFVLRNDGNRHVLPKVMNVTVKGSDGGTFTGTMNGWYILSGRSRSFTMDIPASVCRTAETVSVASELEDGTEISAALPAARGHCGE